MAAFDLPVNDHTLAAIFPRHSQQMRSAIERAQNASASMPPPPTVELDPERLADFVSTVPPIITRLLVDLAPFLSRTRWTLQLISWQTGSYSDSWLALATFWILCFSLSFAVRYFFPILLLAPYILSALLVRLGLPRKERATYDDEHASTETTLHTTLADLTTILHLLPSIPPFTSFNLPTLSIFRLSVAGYIAYATILCIFPPNSIIAIIGTSLLTWRAPWAQTTRNIVISNGWIRYFSKKAWANLTGISPVHPESPITSRSAFGAFLSGDKFGGTKSAESVTDSSLPSDVPPPSRLRFRFTVLENQRWWVGLDWTAALLPQERASWTSAPPALKPVPPPMAISLPPPTSIYLPLNVKGKESLRIKRTATWSWADLAWAVVVRLESTSQPERVVMALPKIDPATAESGMSGLTSPRPEGLLQRGLHRMGTVDLGLGGGPRSPPTSRKASNGYGTGRARSTSPESARRMRLASEDIGTAGGDESADEERRHHGEVDVPLAKEEEESGVTDPEGWSYGDNKWDGAGSKNGMGKFTRARRWTRVALLTETVEIVPATDDPHYIRVPSGSPPPLAVRPPLLSSPRKATKTLPSAPALAAEPPVVLAGNDSGSASGPSTNDSRGNALKQRLQRAVETKT